MKYKAELELEAITPLFMRGATGNAEFRSASVKGVMRWWFRALAGGVFKNNIADLKKAESEIFGSTDQKSKVKVMVSNQNLKYKSNRRYNHYVNYFLLSHIYLKKINYIEEGSSFKITLESEEERKLKMALISLWTSIHLGGFGARSRRFAGNLKISDASSNFDFELKYDFRNFDEFKTTFINIRNMFVDLLGKTQSALNDDIPQYPWIDPKYYLLSLKGDCGNKSWDVAVECFGKWYLGERGGHKFVNGFRYSKAVSDRNFSHILENRRDKESYTYKERRYYLGLPLIYANYHLSVQGKGVKRRASGLIFSLIDINKKYYPLISAFAYIFYPGYNGILSVSRGGHIKIAKSRQYNENNIDAINFYRNVVFPEISKDGFEVIWPQRGGV